MNGVLCGKSGMGSHAGAWEPEMSGSLSEIADVISGYAFKSAWFGAGSDKIIRISDIQDNRVSADNAVVFDASMNIVPEQFKIKSGDILMALSGATTGKIGVVTKKEEGAYLNQRVAIIRGKVKANSDYIKYVLSGENLSKLLMSAGGAAQANLSPKDLAAMQIPLPPLKEQKRIAAILDKADAIRRKRQQAIDLTDQLLRAVFLDMFGDPVTNPKGWDVLPLSTLVSSLEGGKNVKPDESGSETVNRILKVSAVTSGVFKPDESKPLPDGFNPPANYFVNKGDLLISRANTAELIGATAFVHEAQENLILPDKIWRMKWVDSNCVHPLYVHYLFQQASIRREISIRSSGTSGSMKNIPKPKLLEISIPIPITSEQNKFGGFAEKIYLTRKCFKGYGENINELFNSLTQQAFNGELSKQTKAA